MSKQLTYTNELVSLTIMLLMTVALAAGQADARLHKTQPVDASAQTLLTAQPPAEDSSDARFSASFTLQPLIIKIDASADVSRLIPDAR